MLIVRRDVQLALYYHIHLQMSFMPNSYSRHEMYNATFSNNQELQSRIHMSPLKWETN